MVFPPQQQGMFGPMSPFQQPGNYPMLPSQGSGGGLTSMIKGLFGFGKNAGMSQASIPFSTMAQTGMGGGGGFAGSLQNIQQILKMVESTAPVIKQYGPMVKNLPAMIKMMKALSSMESSNEENGTEDEEDDKTEIQQTGIESEDKQLTTDSITPAKKEKRSGESVPLLFI